MTYPRKPCVECGYMVRRVSKPSEHAPTCSERAPDPAITRAVEAWRGEPEIERVAALIDINASIKLAEAAGQPSLARALTRAADLLRAAGGGK